MYKVIQWATGVVGGSAIKAVVGRDDMELVGCLVTNPLKAGQDAGVLSGGERLGVTATMDKEAIFAMAADCVIYTPLVHDTNDVCALLASGKNVITACPYQFIAAGPERAAIDAACAQGATSLLGAGLAPGHFTILLPVAFSALSTNIRSIHVRETGKPAEYPSPLVIGERMKFGKSLEEARSNPNLRGWVLPWYSQSLRLTCRALGFAIDPEIRAEHNVWPATEDFATPIGFIARGTAATQTFQVQATVRGTPVFTYTKLWPSGAKSDCPLKWERGWDVDIEGEPSLKWTCRGFEAAFAGQKDPPAVRATANPLVNAIPQVCAAAPGFVTLAELPPMSARAAAELR